MPNRVAAVGPLAFVVVLAVVILVRGDELAAVGIAIVGGALAALNWRLREDEHRALAAAEDARTGAEAATRRMALLADVGRVAAGALSVRAVAEALVELLVPRVADLCVIEVDDPHGDRRPVAARWDGPDAEHVVGRLLERPAGSAPATDEVVTQLALASSVAIPLHAGGRSVGALHLGVGPSGRTYDDDELELFQIMSGRVALAVGNAALVDEVTATREQLDRTLATLAEAVTVTDRERYMRYANQAAADLLGYDSPEALIGVRLEEIAARWISTHEDGRPLRPEDVPSWRIVNGLEAEPLLTHSVDRETGQARWRLVKAAPLRSTTGELLAVSVIEDVTESKEAELRQRFLAQAGEALASSLNYEETLQRVASLAVPALADWCGVDIVDARGISRPVAVAHVDPAKVAFAREMRERFPPRPEVDQGMYAVIRSGRPELYPDIPDELLEASAQSPEHLELIRKIGIRAAMIVPMVVAGRTIGTITFVTAESRRSFDEDDLAFAGELARRAATAVENSRLYTERTRTAQTLQESLLPARLPSVPGWRTAASYHAGDDTAQVGGDFYDLIVLDRGVLVVIGDVTGKGVEAAALTALARYTLATAARFDPSPGSVVRLLNEVLNERAQSSLLTVVCAYLEPGAEAVRMRLACAGHPPPLLAREGHEAVALACAGLLLGATGDTEWQESEIELQPEDTVLFYTDGVIDTPGTDGRFGEERLRRVASRGSAEPHAIVARVDAAVRDFQRGGVVDDRAMLALQLAALESPAEEGVTGLPARSGALPRPSPR